jgi:hypothetical protein
MMMEEKTVCSPRKDEKRFFRENLPSRENDS